MRNIFVIKPIDRKKPTLIFHPSAANYLGIEKKKMIILCFGSQRQYAEITLSSEVPEKEIHLSSGLIANLHLPDFPDYEIIVSQNQMLIGPFVGMLMSREDKKLTPSALEQLKIYLRDYDELHGAVVVFALDKVDAVGRLIEGFCYNPATRNFERGVYPFPSSIYRAIGLSDHWKNCFFSVIGDNIFNSHYFNKWEMHRWFFDHPDFDGKVPGTSLFRSARDVSGMLEKYGKVFIKPISGLRGRGITQIQFINGTYIFRYRINGINRTEIKRGKEAALEYIDIRFSQGRYLVQQPIELIQIKGCVVDFRCVMQKNQSGEWVCKAIIGRYGDRGSVVSNISSGGTAFKIDDLRYPEIQSMHLEDKIASLAYEACNALDSFGLNCGTLGLDIGVDTEGRPWLIEINNRDPDPTIALDVHDRALYVSLKTGILFYAKFLAGFQ